LKVSTEPLPRRQVLLQIEVDDDRHAQALEKAYRKLAPRVRVPGFRPGKAPRPLIERQLGRHRLLDEAMDLLVPDAYREAIEEHEIDAVAAPTLELVSHEPFVFKATVPIRPVVDLNDYRSLRLKREPVAVSDEEVEASLTSLRRRYGTIEPVDRPAAAGDIVRGDVTAEVDGEQLFSQEEIEFRLSEESLGSLPGLAEGIAGLVKGESKSFTVKVPAEFPDEKLAGKEVTYRVAVHDVKEERLALADDAFAREVGEGFESYDALRSRIRADLLASAEDAALHAYHEAAVDALVEMASLEYPEVLVEREIDRILEEQANLDPRDPRAQQLYLMRLGKSEEEVRAEVRPSAELRLRRSLVLSRLAEAENIEATAADVEAEIERLAESSGAQAEAVRQIFGSESGRESLARSLLTRRTLERLVEIAGGEEPAAAGKKTAAAKKRRSAPREAK
jgi:trigger factor